MNETKKSSLLLELLDKTKKRNPDFSNLLDVLNNRIPKRPTLFEFFLNDDMHEQLTGESVKNLEFNDYNILKMNAYRNAGFDFFTLSFPINLNFKIVEHEFGETISLNDTVTISNIEDFNSYDWPNIETCDFSYLDSIKDKIPKGMKAIPYSPGGVLENVIRLLGYDNMCYLLYDDKEFLKLIFDKVGSILHEYYRKIVGHEIVGAVIINDDWGFNTQTMMNIECMREYVIPWHKKIVDTIHESGKKAILHSCGQLDKLMDDIINYIQYDAKHSYEDNILLVEEAYTIWGNEIAILGGIDLDFIYKSTNKEIYERAINILALTKKNGGYALGTGNSVPHYIENEKYYSLLLAALR